MKVCSINIRSHNHTLKTSKTNNEKKNRIKIRKSILSQ